LTHRKQGKAFDSLSGDYATHAHDQQDGSAPVADATRGRETKGRTEQWEKPGGMNEADKDFDSKNPTNARPLPNGGRVGKLPDGRTIVVRPTSTDGRPTLEIQNGPARIKIRYEQ